MLGIIMGVSTGATEQGPRLVGDASQATGDHALLSPE